LFTLREEQETTLVLVTHDTKLAERCERQYILESECGLTAQE